MVSFPKGACPAHKSHNIHQAPTVCIRHYRERLTEELRNTTGFTRYTGPCSACLLPTYSLHCSPDLTPLLGSLRGLFSESRLSPLNLSFRTEIESHFILAILSNLSLGQAGLPSSGRPHINAYTCHSCTVRASVLSPDLEHLMGFSIAQAPRQLPPLFFRAYPRVSNHFPLFLAPSPPLHPLGSFRFKSWLKRDTITQHLILLEPQTKHITPFLFSGFAANHY